MLQGSPSSLKTPLEDLGAALPWNAAAPDPQLMLGVTSYGIHLSHLHNEGGRGKGLFHTRCVELLEGGGM